MSPRSPRLSLAIVRAELGARGIALTKSDGEYRVNFKGGPESSAYYTTDLDDALATGVDMAARRSSSSSRSNPADGERRTGVKSFAYNRDAKRWRTAWRKLTGLGASVIRAGGVGRNRSWLVYYDRDPANLTPATRSLEGVGSFFGPTVAERLAKKNPVQYEGDDKPTPAARAPRARAPRIPGMDAATRKHLSAWLKRDRPGHQRAARAAIMRALEAAPDWLGSKSWPELEELGRSSSNPGGARARARRPGGRRPGGRARAPRAPRAARARAPRRRRSNPGPGAWSGHASVRGGELFSRRVLRLEYEHVDDAASVSRYHDFGPGVFMYALKDGSVLLRHREHPRKRVWADLPDKAAR